MKEREIYLNAPPQASAREIAAYLDEACGDDIKLRSRLEAMFELSQGSSTFMEAPLVRQLPTGIASEKPDTIIGNYKILQEIGAGGFGTVYMAEQLEPVQRRVALKILKPGMDTSQVVARFEAERQALAMMDHPNIAKVFDAGATEAGRPYFVMELVRGVPITNYCSDEDLSSAGRLKLFIDVCGAIQHAHRKGIIHRDLKPSNIMVSPHDGEPVIKVIDFGIAKAMQSRLTDKTLFTRFDQLIGTPAYMSPEQVEQNGLDVDTQSDVYSLGVLLYELLAGAPPFEAKSLVSAGYEEMRRIIREKEPPKPSTRLAQTRSAHPAHTNQNTTPRSLQGDLDWIVMKALEKDRQRRYETASAMADDVGRHLRSEPVLAGPPGVLYRLKKFVRRRKGLTTGIVSAAVLLLVGFVVMVMVNRELEQREKETRLNLYAADMSNVSQALQTGDLGLARRILGRHHPRDGEEDLRGFEWRHYWHLSRGEYIRKYSGHGGVVTDIAYSPDNRLLASVATDKVVRIWRLGTPDSILTSFRVDDLKEGLRDFDFCEAAFTHDSRYLALMVDNEQLVFYDLTEPTTPRRIEKFSGVRSFALSATRPEILIRGANNLKLVNYESNDTREFGVEMIDNPCFVGADSGKVAYLLPSGRGIGVLDVRSEEISEYPLEGGHPRRIATDPTGKFVAVCYVFGRAFEVIDIATGQRRVGPGVSDYSPLGGWARDAAFSPDGRTVAVCSSDRSVRLYRTENGALIKRLLGHDNEVWRVEFAPDGSSVVSGGRDASILAWSPRQETSGGTKVENWASFHPRRPLCLIRSPGYSGGVVRDLQTGADVQIPSDHILGFSSDGNRIVCARRQTAIRPSFDSLPELQIGSEGAAVQRLQLLLHCNLATSISIDGDFGQNTYESVLAFQVSRGLPETGIVDRAMWESLHSGDKAAYHDTLVYYQLDGREIGDGVQLENCRSYCKVMALASNGRWVVAPEFGGRVGIWDALSGERLQTIHIPVGERLPWRLDISPDGRLLGVGMWVPGVIGRLWDLESGREIRALELSAKDSGSSHQQKVRILGIAHDRSMVAAATLDGTVGIWDLKEQNPVHVFSGHTAGVRAGAFTPDGRTLATAGHNGIVRLWSLTTGMPVGTLDVGFRVSLLTFKQDGSMLVAASGKGHPLHVFRAPKVD